MQAYAIIAKRLRELELQMIPFQEIVNILTKELHNEWEQIKADEKLNFTKCFRTEAFDGKG
jgi:hypothetical protein